MDVDSSRDLRSPLSLALRRVGTEEAPPQSVALVSGEIAVDFIGGGLRTLRYRDREVLCAVAYLVRDKDWGTCSAEIFDCQIRQEGESFEVAYRARTAADEGRQHLEYRARIAGSAGKLLFEVIAKPRTRFLTARTGFAVLHPVRGLAGQPITVEHTDGEVEYGAFPDLIAPYQPFRNIRSMRHHVAPGVAAVCRFEGEVFEMEDQRNWSDASYKTYARPIDLPWPYWLEPGVESRQAIEFEILRDPLSEASSPESPRASGQPPRPSPSPGSRAAVPVEIGSSGGVFPRIGVAVTPEEIASAEAHPELLRKLRPQLLRVCFRPQAGHGRQALAGFARLANLAEGAECELELTVPGERDVGAELLEVAAMVAECGLPLSSVMVSPAADLQATLPGSPWPPCPALAEVYRAARAAFPAAAIGGGMMTYFAELNRKRPPAEPLDFVSHTTCAIIHAADELTVMQSLQALPYVVRSARAIFGPGKPYRLGPATIGMRQNPYGAGVAANPHNRRVTMTDRDPRQRALFAASWMIGYAAATIDGDLEALTVGALTGPLGLAEGSDATELNPAFPLCRPAFHAACGLAELAGHPRYRCQVGDPEAIAAVAGHDRSGRRMVWLANLTGEPRRATLEVAARTGLITGLILDEENFEAPGEIALPPARPTTVELLPYAVASLVVD